MSADDTHIDADALEGLSLIEAALHDDTHDPLRDGGSLLERGEIPRSFHGLELRRLLGRGGMGEVYLARQVSLERDVAVKVRVAPSCDTVDVDELLGREARTLASLEHPGIVRVLDAGSVAGRRFLVMEQVRGRTLREWLERRPDGLSPAAALSVASGIAEALSAAHAAGVVHRDLKPSNVLVGRATGSPSRVRLVDFGIAGRAFDAGESHEMGTWEAMAPEQRAGEPVGPPADVYALGLLLSTMIDGRQDVPGELHRLVASFSATDPARRPADGAAAAERLAAVRLRRPGPSLADPRLLVLAAMLLLVLGGFLGGLFDEQPEADPQDARRRLAPPAAEGARAFLEGEGARRAGPLGPGRGPRRGTLGEGGAPRGPGGNGPLPNGARPARNRPPPPGGRPPAESLGSPDGDPPLEESGG